ncbi:GNAT family N-acetyltransferase [Streptosporangium algeriense]|uniref:GNAT family N-acetyltransferase n=1 Tax=Streptosporangium algeriense TaxID=1682748 RepID=A0ABW3DUL8_9ACTN
MELSVCVDLSGEPAWHRLWRADAHRHPYYLPAELAHAAAHYQPVYYLDVVPSISEHRPPAKEFVPRHLLAHDEEGPVLGLPLTLERFDGRTRLSAFGRPLYAVEDRSASPQRRRRAALLVHRHLEELRHEHAAEPYFLRDFLTGGDLSPLAEAILRAGGSATPYFTQMVDLGLDATWLNQDLRENFRRVLRRPRPRFTLDVVRGEQATEEHRDLLRRLHVALRGREVRSPVGWDAVLTCVRRNEGFFVFAREDDEPIGGAYFPHSDIYCYYAFAGHDPERTGDGLSHRIIWHAVMFAQSLGCRYFEVGDRLFPGPHAHVPDKYHTISHFKAGFSSTVTTRLDVISG